MTTNEPSGEAPPPEQELEQELSSTAAATPHQHEPKSNAHHFLEALGPAFARNKSFWISLWWSSVFQGAIMALVALAFFNLYVAIAKATWLTDDYHHALAHVPVNTELLEEIIERFPFLDGDRIRNATEKFQEEHGDEHGDILYPLRLGNGEWWYVALLACGGLAVGLIKVVWSCLFPKHKFPRQLPSFLTEVRALQAHDIWLPLPILACSGISLGFGASVGPEAALGATGATLGSLVFARRWRIGNIQANPASGTSDQNSENQHWLSKILPDLSEEPELCALDGLTGAFGALFPSQFLSGLMVHELGYSAWNDKNREIMFRHSFMETVSRTAFSSTVAYLIFTTLEDRTLLEQINLPFAAYSLQPEIRAIDMVSALILGILSGLVGLLGFLMMGFFGKLGNAVFEALDGLGQRMGLKADTLATILTPTIGGALLGLLCKAVPLVIGDGADQLSSLIVLSEELGIGVIVACGFIKYVTLGISLGFGFVGGPIFPFIYVGTCMGIIVHMLVEDVPAVIAISSCMVAVPCAFVPAIFSMTTLASVTLALGGAATSPVFFACAVSYTTVAGMGVIQDLIWSKLDSEKADKAVSEEEGDKVADESDKMVSRDENEKVDDEAEVVNKSTGAGTDM